MEQSRSDLTYIHFYNFVYKFSYITKEDWSHIVSKYTKESRHLDITKNANEIIYKLNDSLKLKYSSIIFNSMIFFHRYYIYNLYSNNHFELDNSKLAIIAVTCFFIATKSFDVKIKIDVILEYSYKCGVLQNNQNQKNKEELLFYEQDILCVNGFNINDFGITYTDSYTILEEIFKLYKIQIKDSSLKRVKKSFYRIIRLSFIFPFFLNYSPKTIVLSCINTLFKLLFPNYSNQIFDGKEYSDIRTDIINCSNLFEHFFIIKKENTNDNIISNIINNTNHENVSSNENNVEKEESELNFEIIRTINSSQNNNSL